MCWNKKRGMRPSHFDSRQQQARPCGSGWSASVFRPALAGPSERPPTIVRSTRGPAALASMLMILESMLGELRPASATASPRKAGTRYRMTDVAWRGARMAGCRAPRPCVRQHSTSVGARHMRACPRLGRGLSRPAHHQSWSGSDHRRRLVGEEFRFLLRIFSASASLSVRC